MKATKLAIVLTALSVHLAIAQEEGVKENTQNLAWPSLALPHIQVIPIKDSKADRQYELYVKLPEGYAEHREIKYPVIYYTDAMWHLEILSAATEYMLDDVILVGISWQKDINEDLKKEVGAHVSRFRDYSLMKSTRQEIQEKYQLGQANGHLDFIRHEVIKYVDNTYRTDPDSRTYFGYSLGGEFGAYILLTQPHTFDNYILGSPSIKSEIPYLAELNAKLAYRDSTKNNSLHANVFLSRGTLEQEAAEPIEAFGSLLKDRRDPGLSLHSKVIEGDHESAFPLTAVSSVAWLSTLIRGDSTSNPELSFWEQPLLNKAFINAAPEDRKDGLSVGELGIDGGQKEMILKLAKEIANHKHGGFDSFLITHKDTLIFESYYQRGRINLPHGQASATKAYTGLALGRAIQLGYLTMDDLNKPLVSFLKDLDPTKLVEGAEKITLHHALTMRSGIRISEEQREAMNKKPDQLKGQGEVQSLLTHSTPITEESQVFNYGGDPALVMQVIEAVVPASAKDFIKKELLDKLGIKSYIWKTAPSGLPESGWRTSMTSRDMVKWGTLVMNNGKWNGEQLIPEAFIAKATRRILQTGDDDIYGGGKDVSHEGYGYFWWSADLKHGAKSYYGASAQGGGGQYILLIKELDLLIVVTGHDNDNATLQLAAERVIPAFVGS